MELKYFYFYLDFVGFVEFDLMMYWVDFELVSFVDIADIADFVDLVGID